MTRKTADEGTQGCSEAPSSRKEERMKKKGKSLRLRRVPDAKCCKVKHQPAKLSGGQIADVRGHQLIEVQPREQDTANIVVEQQVLHASNVTGPRLHIITTKPSGLRSITSSRFGRFPVLDWTCSFGRPRCSWRPTPDCSHDRNRIVADGFNS